MFWMLDVTITLGVAWPPYEFVADLILLSPTVTLAILLIRSINNVLQ